MKNKLIEQAVEGLVARGIDAHLAAEIVGSDHPDSLDIREIREGEHVVVQTTNNEYEFRAVNPGKRRFEIKGGLAFPDYRPCLIIGASQGSASIKLNYIVPGMKVEFYRTVEGKRGLLSSVVKIKVEDAAGEEVDYKGRRSRQRLDQ